MTEPGAKEERSRAGRSRVTREALIGTARRLFGALGFADASTTQIVREAGVTRGALYHHFPSKEDLFEAVYEDVEQDLTARVASVLGGSDGVIDQLKKAAGAFLDACLEPDVRRIVLLEGPTVLGWERWREIDQRYGLGLVQGGLELAMEAGDIPRRPVEPLAHLLMGALIEAGLVVAYAPDPEHARREMGDALGDVLDGFAALA